MAAIAHLRNTGCVHGDAAAASPAWQRMRDRTARPVHVAAMIAGISMRTFA
jgi:hypothetical protein